MLSKRPKCIFFATQLLALMVWITQALAGQAQLAWNAPTTNTDGTTLTNLAGYKLRYWQTNSGTPQNLDVGNQTSYTLTGLVDGATYSFVVNAYNTSGIISSDSNVLTVTVPASNRPPVAVADTATTPAGAPVTISVLANDSDPDGDPLRITAVTQGAHGTVTFTTTSVTYTPVSTYSGTDSFTYTITDGRGAYATAPVTVTVKAVGKGKKQPIATQVSASSVTSTATSTDTSTVTATAIVTLQLEAETGTLHSPIEVQADKTTPTTQYVWVPDSAEDLLDPLQPGGYAQYSFTVPHTDAYVIWGRVSPSATGLGSFFLGVDVRGDNGLVLGISPTTYQLATIRLGATYYVDSPYTITTMPTGLDGLAALKTANADKQNNSPDFLTFTTVHDATLYVAYDATVSSFPSWLSASFTNTGQIIQTTNGPMAVWKQDVPAGPITLPGNQYQEPTPVKSQYFVLLDVHGQEPLLMWDVTPTQTSGTSPQPWVWDQAASSTTPVFYLEAGSHTLTIKQRESGTKLDKLMITNDVTLVPHD
jgi:Bacterial Ig domain/Fibronectin type III domain